LHDGRVATGELLGGRGTHGGRRTGTTCNLRPSFPPGRAATGGKSGIFAAIGTAGRRPPRGVTAG
jgi:hypothetical protein